MTKRIGSTLESLFEELDDLDEVRPRVSSAYEGGECPDCGEPIPDDMVDGGECSNCGHVFHEE